MPTMVFSILGFVSKSTAIFFSAAPMVALILSPSKYQTANFSNENQSFLLYYTVFKDLLFFPMDNFHQ